MTINLKRARQYLEAFDFKRLFAEELGWSLANSHPTTIEVDGAAYRTAGGPQTALGGVALAVGSQADDDGREQKERQDGDQDQRDQVRAEGHAHSTTAIRTRKTPAPTPPSARAATL